MAGISLTITASADSSWRESTHHITYSAEGEGECYIDFKLTKDGASAAWQITNSSFDGEGCCSAKFDNVPADVAESFFKGLDNDGDKRELSGAAAESALVALRKFFTSRRDDVPEVWREVFETYKILDAADE